MADLIKLERLRERLLLTLSSTSWTIQPGRETGTFSDLSLFIFGIDFMSQNNDIGQDRFRLPSDLTVLPCGARWPRVISCKAVPCEKLLHLSPFQFVLHFLGTNADQQDNG